MNNNNKYLTLELLLQSLENDFDNQERELIFNELKNTIPTDDALLGAKLILEQNNWDYKALKHVFNKVERKIENLVHENSGKKSKTSYLKYVAILIPIVIITGYLINQTRKESIDEYYIEEVGLPSLMSVKKTNWDELMELYKTNKFEKALALTKKIKVQKPENDTVNYFQGVIAYDLKKYDLAKEDFEKVIENKQSAFYNDAEFRLGFALKHIDQDKESIRQFEKVIGNSNNPYGDEAAKVLKILDSSK